jgi:hypothetical protein
VTLSSHKVGLCCSALDDAKARLRADGEARPTYGSDPAPPAGATPPAAPAAAARAAAPPRSRLSPMMTDLLDKAATLSERLAAAARARARARARAQGARAANGAEPCAAARTIERRRACFARSQLPARSV